MSREGLSESFERPDSEIITAYLMGTASEKQKQIVRKVLLQSSTFRKEILQMAQDIEMLSDEDIIFGSFIILPSIILKPQSIFVS